MMFTGPGFDGLGAVFAEGMGDGEKAEESEEKGAFLCARNPCRA
jgi:hypothetical protein